MARLLIVDDEEAIRKLVRKYAEFGGHEVIPRGVTKKVADVIEIGKKVDKDGKRTPMTSLERQRLIDRLTDEMKEAARMLEFEKAAFLRDRIRDLRTTK